MNDPEFHRRLYDYTEYWDLFDHAEAEWSSSEFIRREHHRRKKEKRKLRQSGGLTRDSTGTETLYLGTKPQKRLVRYGEQPPAAVPLRSPASVPVITSAGMMSMDPSLPDSVQENPQIEAALPERSEPPEISSTEMKALQTPAVQQPQVLQLQQQQEQPTQAQEPYSKSSWFALAAEFDKLDTSTYMNDPEFVRRLNDVTTYWDLFDDPNAEWTSSEFIRREHHRRKKEKRKMDHHDGHARDVSGSETLYVGPAPKKKLVRFGEKTAAPAPPGVVDPTTVASSFPQAAPPHPPSQKQQQQQSQAQAQQSSASSYFSIASQFDKVETSTYMNDPEFQRRLYDYTQYWDLFDHPEAEWSSSEFIRREHHRRKKEKRKLRQSGGAPIDTSSTDTLYVGNAAPKRLKRWSPEGN
jgi:hypothetical protein